MGSKKLDQQLPLAGTSFEQTEKELRARLRQQAEALRESETKFRAVTQSTPEAIVIADRWGNIVFWNKGAQSTFGYTEGEALGQPLALLIPERYREDHRREIERFHSTGQSEIVGKTIELRGLKQDGSEFPLELSLATWQSGEETFYSGIIRDITKRKRVEEALRESQARFESLFESAPDATVLVNNEGRIVHLNRQTEVMFGYNREELLNKPIEVLLPTRLRGQHVQHRSAYFADPHPRPMGVGLELSGRRKDGGEFPVEITLSPVNTQEGTLAISLVRDITRRKQAEEKLRYAQGFSERLINSSLDGILAFDRECRFTAWNPGMERLTGVSKTKLLGQYAFEVFPFLQETGEDKYFYEALAGQAVIARDRPYLVPETGRVGFFEGYYSPVRDESGAVVGGLAIIRDITERKQVEEGLKRSQRQYEDLVNTIDSIVWERDVQTFEFHFVSRQAERLLGYPTARWIAEPAFWQDHIHPDDRQWAIDFCKKATTEKRSHEFEYRMLAADGRTVWLREMVAVVVENDQPVKLRGVMMDITTQKQMQAELAEVQHRLMEGREAERLHLAQELHDGPVQDLYSASYWLSELQGALPDEASLAQLAAAQTMLQQVIQGLRTTAGEMRPPTLAMFGLEKAIRSHVERFQAAHPGLKVQLELTPDGQILPERVRLALFRICQEALNNVARHAGAQQVWIRFILNAEQVGLEVQDDGHGFEVPWRWIRLTRQGHLGLAGMSERAEAIGGRLKVISAPGAGTTIQVIVPYKETETSYAQANL